MIDTLIDTALAEIFLATYLCFPVGIAIFAILSFVTARLFLLSRLAAYVQRGYPQRLRACISVGLFVVICLYAITARGSAVMAGVADSFAPSHAEVYELWVRYLIPAPIRAHCVLRSETVCEGADRFSVTNDDPPLSTQLSMLLIMLPFGLIASGVIWFYKVAHAPQRQHFSHENG